MPTVWLQRFELAAYHIAEDMVTPCVSISLVICPSRDVLVYSWANSALLVQPFSANLQVPMGVCI